MMSHVLPLLTLGVVANAENFPPCPFECTKCDLPYVTVGGTDLLLDVYIPEQAKGPVPAVIFIHGGAWMVGSRKMACRKALPSLLPEDIGVVAIDYRLTKQIGEFGNESVTFPAQIDDSFAALQWVQKNGAEYGIDTSRLGAWGESAGGHLVSLLTTKGASLGPSTTLAVAVDMFGPTDFLIDNGDNTPMDELMGFSTQELAKHETRKEAPWPQELAEVKGANPITFVGPSTPPMFLAHGLSDTMVVIKNSESLAAALSAHNLTFKFERVPGGEHMYKDWPKDPIKHAAEFCIKYLLPGKDLAAQLLV